MPINVIERTMAEGVDGRFEINNESGARKWNLPITDPSTVGGSVGTNWTKILISMHYTFNPKTLAYDATTPAFRLFLGAQSGDDRAKVFGSGQETHLFGAEFNNSTFDLKDGGANLDYFVNGSVANMRYLRRIDGADGIQTFNTAFLTASGDLKFAADLSGRAVWFVQLEKLVGGTEMGCATAGPWKGGVEDDVADISYDDWQDAMNTLTDISLVNSWNSAYQYAPNSGTLTLDQANDGYIDAIAIGFTGTLYLLEWCAVDIRVLA